MNKSRIQVILAIIITAVISIWLTSTGFVSAAKKPITSFAWSNLWFGKWDDKSTTVGYRPYQVDRHYDSEFWVTCYVSQSNYSLWSGYPTSISCVKIK